MPLKQLAKTLTAKEWRDLPPRSNDPVQICNLIGGTPEIMSGICGHCSTSFNDQWAMNIGGSSISEFRHLSDQDIALLCPTESKILNTWLEASLPKPVPVAPPQPAKSTSHSKGPLAKLFGYLGL